MNEITTTSAPELTELRSLEELDAAVVGHFLDLDQCLKEYRRHGLSGTEIGKRVRSLGADISDRSVRRHLQGFSMPKPQSDNPEAVKKRKQREKGTNGQNGQMSPPQPSTTKDSTNDQPDPQPVRTTLCTVVPELEPLSEATVVEDGTCIPMGTYEQQQGQSDYLEACRLINQLATVFERNAFQPRMFPDDWRSIHGGLRGLVETAEVQTRYSARFLEG